ncbi:MAG: hypothetical protein AAFO99_11690 [Bacteroidota bacterium]
MKTIATLIFVLFIGVAAQAQDSKVETIEMEVVTSSVEKELTMEGNKEVARLYRRANTEIKKALSFTTKRNRAKLA